MRPSKRRFLSVSGLAFAIVPVMQTQSIASTATALRTAVLTVDGPPFVLRVSGVKLTIGAELRDAGNEREAIWLTGSTAVTDSTECSEWLRGSGLDQQGVVFRLTDSSGTIRAITITRNVYGREFSDFNFHVWTSTGGSVTTLQLFGQTDLTGYLPAFPAPAVYPLDFCGRTIGNLAQFVVWRPGSPRPKWGNAKQGGSARIPSGAPTRGMTGWYVGHVDHGAPTTMTLGPVR
jgi:hypothetical protein